MQSVSSIAQNLISKYDKNYNGVIQLDSFSNEGSKDVRTVNTGWDKDIITVTRYSQKELFRKADKNYDNKVTRAELERYISQYDRDRDGFLDDYDPWSNQITTERERFDRENRENSYVVSSNVVYHYPNHPGYDYPNYPNYPNHPGHDYPNYPNYPNHPGHDYPNYPNYPGHDYPNYPNHPGHPGGPGNNFPNYPGHPGGPGGHHPGGHGKKDNDVDFKIKLNIKL